VTADLVRHTRASVQDTPSITLSVAEFENPGRRLDQASNRVSLALIVGSAYACRPFFHTRGSP
jgi:hypothetical protein